MVIENPIELGDNNNNGMLQNVSQERNQKQYKLHFDKGTDGKIRGFCDSFNIEKNIFIEIENVKPNFRREVLM
jgi:hypothetical protein